MYHASIIEASLSCVYSRLGPAGGVWYRELSEGVGQVWELQYLAVALEGTQGENLPNNVSTQCTCTCIYFIVQGTIHYK